MTEPTTVIGEEQARLHACGWKCDRRKSIAHDADDPLRAMEIWRHRKLGQTRVLIIRADGGWTTYVEAWTRQETGR